MIMLILTIIAITGAITVALGKPLTANSLWLISNPAMAIHNYNIHEFEIAGMFVVYAFIALYGIYNLRLKQVLFKKVVTNDF